MQAADGTEQSLEAYQGSVLLIVNVASHCGYTDVNYRKSITHMTVSKYNTVCAHLIMFTARTDHAYVSDIYVRSTRRDVTRSSVTQSRMRQCVNSCFMYVCTSYVCMYMYIYVCVYIHTYICACIYIKLPQPSANPCENNTSTNWHGMQHTLQEKCNSCKRSSQTGRLPF